MASSPALERPKTEQSALPDGSRLMFEEQEGENNSLGALGVDSNDDDYGDFPLDIEDEEYKEDYFDTQYTSSHQPSLQHGSHANNNDAWVQLLNLPPAGVPVGGMRRVSSCYFSIASNLSNENSSSPAFLSPNPSYHNSVHRHYDALSFDGRNASDFLLHDILMNVFSFLDAQSLASFSETGRRPNFEVFYFLELQLQRALLMGDGHNHFGSGEVLDRVDEDDDDNIENDDNNDGDIVLQAEEDGGDDDSLAVQNEAEGEDDDGSNSLDDDSITDDSNSAVLPSFEGSIAGTGVISRLASLDSAAARKIVQTYLDSNTSIRAMPLSHSLAYFRQVLLRQHPSSSPFPQRRQQQQQPPNPSADNMAKNARNMAIFFTFLGAAYMRAQQGGDVPMPMPTMPDPSEVLNEENMEVLKNMMLKVGLAGGFLKAGKTMKEKAEQANANAAAAVSGSNENGDDHSTTNPVGNDADLEGENGQHDNPVGMSANQEDVTDGTDAGDADVGNGRPSSQQRSTSIGSIEDFSNMIPHPSAIASRLYNAFSNNAANSSQNTAAVNSNPTASDEDNTGSSERRTGDSDGTSSPKRRHRGKRSHKTLRQDEMENEYDYGEEKKSASEPLLNQDAVVGEESNNNVSSLAPASGEHAVGQKATLSPEAIAYAMEHPFSPNPYDHPSSSSMNTMASAVENKNEAASDVTTSLFSFNFNQEGPMSSAQQQLSDSGNMPTGCVGAYARAVRNAASEVSRLVKAERKSNFESLSPAEQIETGQRFIDACTSDTKLHIVKEILQKQKKMDVDRFFIGPDDTETCALHAAAFNGAEGVLQFLCGGIDERDPGEDCGLCDVNVRDANGWTALHFAAGANSVTSVRVLADHGAKLTIEASNGYTPYHWAERLSNEEVASELESLGADNRFVGSWMFGGGGNSSTGDRTMPFVSFLANRFFAFNR